MTSNKGLIAIIIGILSTGLILSVASKTTKVVKATSAINKIKKVQKYEPSPTKIFSRANDARNIAPVLKPNDKKKINKEDEQKK